MDEMARSPIQFKTKKAKHSIRSLPTPVTVNCQGTCICFFLLCLPASSCSCDDSSFPVQENKGKKEKKQDVSHSVVFWTAAKIRDFHLFILLFLLFLSQLAMATAAIGYVKLLPCETASSLRDSDFD